MSVDTLLELLTREAEASARELVTAGEQRARSIDDAAEASARSRRGHELARLEAEARHAVACETAAAEQRLRRAGSEARAEVLRRIFAEAEALLAHAAAAEYQSGLDALLETTLGYLDGPVVLRCRPDAAPLIEQLLHGRGDVEVRAGGEEAAGVRGEAADGSVVIDNTLPRRLEQRRGALAIELTARIEAP